MYELTQPVRTMLSHVKYEIYCAFSSASNFILDSTFFGNHSHTQIPDPIRYLLCANGDPVFVCANGFRKMWNTGSQKKS